MSAAVQHFRERAAERFGVELSAEHEARIVDLIRQREALFLERQGGVRLAYLVEINQIPAVVIADLRNSKIVTVFAPTSPHWVEVIERRMAEQRALGRVRR